VEKLKTEQVFQTLSVIEEFPTFSNFSEPKTFKNDTTSENSTARRGCR
jgi:hypothetical protein